MTPSCRVCGRPLRSKKWAARRIGPVCERRTRTHTAPPSTHTTPGVSPEQIELTWST